MDSLTSPVIVSISREGAKLARELARQLDASWHVLAGKHDDNDPQKPEAQFTNTIDHIRMLFYGGKPIIGICSAGILMRALNGLLADKWREPPVLAIADDGSFIIPLLGGHRGGNILARQCAGITGGQAAITTSGEVRLGVALDNPPLPFVLAYPDEAKAVMAALNDGASLRLVSDLPEDMHAIEHQWRDWLKPLTPHRDDHGEGRDDSQADISLILTLAPHPLSSSALIFHPRIVFLGVGAARGCPDDEMAQLVENSLEAAAICPQTIRGLYSVDIKADEKAILHLADAFGHRLNLFSTERLEEETPRLANPSKTVFREIGCHGVAEAAALAAAGPQARLVITKQKTSCATMAAAARLTNETPPDDATPLGQVMLVGIGPGQAEWRTPEATSMIAIADELVGYHLYIDLLGGLAAGKKRRDFNLGEEEKRCRYALNEAAKGKSIAMICSGDAGIYAMGALIYEMLARDGSQGGIEAVARRVQIITAPGVSAMQAAAARAGAPLGHDFCAISLSDLLTPWDVIARRIDAAGCGDFVIAFYNPVSRRRREGITRARDILLKYRPDHTPVILAANLGRDDETLRFRNLGSLNADEIDMMTLVIVGATESKLIEQGGKKIVYTPRGYAKHMDNKERRK